MHKLENMPRAMRAVLLGALAPRDVRHHSAASMAAALRVAMKPRRSRPIFAQLATPALAVLLLQAWALYPGAAERPPQASPSAPAVESAAQLDQLDKDAPGAEPAAQLDQRAAELVDPPAAQLDQPAEPAAQLAQPPRATVLAGSAAPARPRRKTLR